MSAHFVAPRAGDGEGFLAPLALVLRPRGFSSFFGSGLGFKLRLVTRFSTLGSGAAALRRGILRICFPYK